MSRKVELTDKEMIVVWSIIAWFQTDKIASGKLVRKFYPSIPDKQYRYDKKIEDSIIRIAKFIESDRIGGARRK